MMSLPFMYGFVNERWTKVIDVMLEKKQGNRKIHMLRIIALLEADFNTALKILFSQKLIKNAEKAGLNDEQWGSRKDRMAMDPAMRNLMAFEYGRYMRIVIAMFAADLTACFDRMFPSLSNVSAGKFGMEKNVLLSRGKTIQKMRRAVRTGHGVSEATYGNEEGEPEIAGELQGKGDVAILYCLQSSITLDAHAKLFPELVLPSPGGGRAIRKRNDGYVDDVNTWAGKIERDLGDVEEVMYDLQVRAQGLTDLNEVSGGSTAFHKCACQLLSWRSTGKTLEINYDMEGVGMVLTDAKGAASKIRMLSPSGTNKGLGYFQAVDANQKVEYEERMGKIKKTCSAANSARLQYSEAKQLLERRLLMQTRYGLTLSQFTKAQCERMSAQINKTFLPLMRINRHMPRAVVYGPVRWGGLGLNTDMYCLQLQCAMVYLVRVLRWDKIVADDIITAIDALQLRSGFVSPVLEEVSTPIVHAGKGWLLNLMRAMMREYDVSAQIEHLWKPSLQRENDVALLEAFSKIDGIKPREMILASEFRIWLRVTMLSELADEQGTKIERYKIMNGSEWRATTTLKGWPTGIVPTDEHRRVFRHCLRATVCTGMNKYGAVRDYELSTPMGGWYPVPRAIEYSAYRSEDTVFMRDEEGLHECTPIGNGHYEIKQETVLEPPVRSHPIPVNMSGPGVLWTHRPARLVETPQVDLPATVTLDEIEDDVQEIDLISDAAVHVEEGKGGVCWRAIDANDKVCSERFPIE
eukprot:scaffold93176_cov89-Cyclotella_meneghiniana.AAC.1